MTKISLDPSKGRPDYEENKAAYLKSDRIRATVIWVLMGLALFILCFAIVTEILQPPYLGSLVRDNVIWYLLGSLVLLPIVAMHIWVFESPGKSLLSMLVWQLYMIEIIVQEILLFSLGERGTNDADLVATIRVLTVLLGLGSLIAYIIVFIAGLILSFLKPEKCLKVPWFAAKLAFVLGVLFISLLYGLTI